ncbi:tRNA (adenosine(37)-N6)-dimethylallyltransferase MiaA [Phototrophicus methaneseepsis]|uniref:tRNA dimethylallyltransferase n=1 Tax=Phototrophicus methaneseepsis TaxID=2710758 RepID=A0A7S8IDI9_9CHLR|nr:tRNA (adenosine(37)-N6)-dimethylallyltransferase MiaA [Phototrophicus methaneseepsis]QPC81419.1 tRNA (adenosine(37)-N6)-dimethylallyltransferase MiaA [Phototrophicus methaneseepsis]
MTGNVSSTEKRPLVIILGATATGKTHLAIEIAQALNGEVVGADSRQIYRYMDIGTAKPTPEERAAAPHHLVDYVEPDDHISLAQYQASAYAAIDNIHQRGKLPLLVGGTGQYITAVAEGWSIPEVPPNWPLRDELEHYAAQEGADALHARLTAHDPVYAAKIHPNNIRRVVRALEICLTTGDTVTNLQRKQPPPYRMYTIGLQMDRENLYARADHRFDMMMKAGFLDEVQALLNRGYERHLPAFSAVGYAELLALLCDNANLEEMIAQAKNNTHDFIRRQEIWFRGHDHGILWHNTDQNKTQSIVQSVARWYEEQG